MEGSRVILEQKKLYDVYWANSLFSCADRKFNEECVEKIRERGYVVFLSQEQSINKTKNPTEQEIFKVDTEAIYESKVLVACIDQETIDCGVACEIGIAFERKIPIIGLYTDIRKDRNQSKMYKNPYVVGAIMACGKIVHRLEDVIVALPNYLS